MNREKTFDVFLSHHSSDKPWVDKLKSALKGRGLNVWFDKDEILPGDLLANEIEQGIENSKAVAVVISPEALKSQWVDLEKNLALSLALKQELRLIPVALAGATPPGLLGIRKWVDFSIESQFAASFELLISGITGKKPGPADLAKDELALDPLIYGQRVVGFQPVASSSIELWQDRDPHRRNLRKLLLEGKRIISVIGRRGIGKSAVVTKVLVDLEKPDEGNITRIDGIVYMSTRIGSPEMTLATIFHQIVKLLPESEQIRLSNRWAGGGEETFVDLFASLRARRVVVVLDNLDDFQEKKTGAFRTPDVPRFLEAVVKAQRAPQVVTTSQQPLALPPGIRPSLAELEIEDGLAAEFGVALLVSGDRLESAELKQLDAASLQTISNRVGGIPRGLELIGEFVKDNRIDWITQLFESNAAPEEVLKELVIKTYEDSRGAARDIMDIIAVAGVALPANAFESLFADQSSDKVKKARDNLVKRKALNYGKDLLVRLHPLDTDYIQSKLKRDRFAAFDLRLAEWYARGASSRDTWRRLPDAGPVKQEYRHRWHAGQRAEALDVLAGAALFLARHGDSAVLRAAVAEADEAGLNTNGGRNVCLGAAEFYSGSLEKAIECFRNAARIPGAAPDWDMWAGIALRHIGRGREAAQALSPIASDDRHPRKLRIKATFELGLAWCYAGCLDEAAAAISRLKELIEPEKIAPHRAYVADVTALVHLMAGRFPETVSAVEEGIAAYADSPSSPTAGYIQNTRGLALLLMGRAAEAAPEFLAVSKGAAAVGQDRLEGIALANLAWASLHLGKWEESLEAAQQSLERLKSTNTVAPKILTELLTASAENDIEELLRRSAEGTETNPDFYRPRPDAIKELGSALLRRRQAPGNSEPSTPR